MPLWPSRSSLACGSSRGRIDQRHDSVGKVADDPINAKFQETLYIRPALPRYERSLDHHSFTRTTIVRRFATAIECDEPFPVPRPAWIRRTRCAERVGSDATPNP